MGYDIDIDGYISADAYSKDYVKQILASKANKAVTMRISSQGGSLMHGLAMSDRIGEHGNVEVSMYGFNASAATVATLKAKSVKMASNSFYLIHKIMNPVMVMEMMNADEMRALVDEILANADENDKLDKVLAQMYCDKTGKTLAEILAMMKTGGWLTAQEAKDMGFVDEVFKSSDKVNMSSMESKLNVFGLPTHGLNQSNLFTNQTSYQMKKQFDKVNTVIGVAQLESSEDGVFLNETQIEALDTAIVEAENSVTAITADRDTAVANATTLQTTLDSQTAEIANLTTQVENLKSRAGATTQSVNQQTDEQAEGSKDNVMATMNAAREIYNFVK